MNADQLIDSFSDFKDIKNIDRETMMNILEDVFHGMLKRKFGEESSCDVIVNTDKGHLELYHDRIVVEDGKIEDPDNEIEISAARKEVDDIELGEEFTETIEIEDFGRRAILSLRQNLSSKIHDLEKSGIYEKYKDRVGDIISGEVYQIWKREILILDEEGNELILPRQEQIPSDFYKKGDSITAVVARVEMRNNNNPVIVISRTSPVFLQKLFEREVPEVFDGLITIKKIVREPGERAKVAVESYDDRIDPVGACVGMKGARIHGIVRELRNENIDVINFTSNLQLFISRALSPAKISTIEIDEDEKRAKVFLKPDQVSMAIGKGGYNIRLAGKLTGYELDVFREGAVEIEDVDLDEFADEIEHWIIDELKAIGCDTAMSVLDISKEDLVKRTDLEEETIDEVVNILKSEFE